MNVLSIPNWTVNFSSFHIDISLRKKRERVVLKGEAGEWNYKTGHVGFIVWSAGRVLPSPSWTSGGIILASFRNSEDWETITSELPQDSIRLLLGVQCVPPKYLELRWLWVCVYMCVFHLQLLNRTLESLPVISAQCYLQLLVNWTSSRLFTSILNFYSGHLFSH